MKKKMSLLAVLLMAVAVTAYSVSGTYAKYTSTKELSDSARVAKWDIKLGADSLWDSTATFNLFDYVDANVDVDGSGSETVIAPGTTGTITLPIITNDSEVTAKYSIELSLVGTTTIPLEFSTNGTDWYSIANLSSTKVEDTLAMGAAQTTGTSIQWRWSFERGDDDTEKASNDSSDTTLGIAGTESVEIKATITATQVD